VAARLAVLALGAVRAARHADRGAILVQPIVNEAVAKAGTLNAVQDNTLAAVTAARKAEAQLLKVAACAEAALGSADA